MRRNIPFRSINRPDAPDYNRDLHRHHIIPRQAIGMAALGPLWGALGMGEIGYDDFRRNGLLLPACESASLRLGLPLHAGPHRHYNEMVIERLGRIESDWSRQRQRSGADARSSALMRLRLLQTALRRRILDQRRPLRFSRRDPLGAGRDFALLDMLAETLWTASDDQALIASEAERQPARSRLARSV